ncbi:hypothetical protein, partial [Streptomyces sp. NPDC001226]
LFAARLGCGDFSPALDGGHRVLGDPLPAGEDGEEFVCRRPVDLAKEALGRPGLADAVGDRGALAGVTRRGRRRCGGPRNGHGTRVQQ